MAKAIGGPSPWSPGNSQPGDIDQPEWLSKCRSSSVSNPSALLPLRRVPFDITTSPPDGCSRILSSSQEVSGNPDDFRARFSTPGRISLPEGSADADVRARLVANNPRWDCGCWRFTSIRHPVSLQQERLSWLIHRTSFDRSCPLSLENRRYQSVGRVN